MMKMSNDQVVYAIAQFTSCWPEKTFSRTHQLESAVQATLSLNQFLYQFVVNQYSIGCEHYQLTISNLP